MASNAKPFTVTVPPVVTNASPLSAIPGQQVTIIGSGFGSTQGLGSVWLDDTFGTVVSWSDTQVVATVSLQARSGTAKVLQSGLWSNEVRST